MSRLGGDLTWGEWLASAGRRKLEFAPSITPGKPPCWQCRCGATVIVKYRGRFYCRHCGHRLNGYCPRRLSGNACGCSLPLPAPATPRAPSPRRTR